MLDNTTKVTNIILLGPQDRFRLQEFKKRISTPVDAIKISNYGVLNGKIVLDQTLQLTGGS